ncbi:MAG: protein kinase [Anaerolineaceae bacterium]|jgi:serine/threonine-protein kinase|nr:protein kinase [Anaerolineaceae bacterium]
MDNHFNQPTILGDRYILKNTIGTGGMAVVYQGYDTALDRTVAIKILRKDYSKNQEVQALFRQEAKSAANLAHPNIITIHDFGFDEDHIFIIMEYVPGPDLKTLIRQRADEGRVFSVDETVSLITQASAGIGYAHRAGIVHCDVKPQNLIVTAENRLKVADFGISRLLSTIQPDEQNDFVWGSPFYMSPEQAAGKAPVPASDVYSLGIIMYEMLTGRLPFHSDNIEDLIEAHKSVVPVHPRAYNREIPQELEKIILKVLSKEPASRYRMGDQFGRILQSFSAHQAAAEHSQQNHNQAMDEPDAQPWPTPINAESIPSTSLDAAPDPEEEPVSLAPEIDWGTAGLGLLAFILAAGLIPFWLYIWFTLNAVRP